ncbi:MAG: hypothetical protein ACE5E6_09850 [Phycisphaerae bacterium]
MLYGTQWHRSVVLGVLAGFLNGAGAYGAVVDGADGPDAKFHKAYYLEREHDDCAGAAELYAAVVADRDVGAALKAKARTRLAACREELATPALARLMPPDALAYAELGRPGARLLSLLEQLGLAGDGVAEPEPGRRRLAISPALVKAVLGIKGAAVAITGFDPSREQPTGVAVLHPGNVDIIRGFIETALPAAGVAVDPIDGFATYSIEREALVTLTHKLVVISHERSAIEDVVRRLRGDAGPSLADSAMWRDVVGDADAGRLLSICINAKAVMPMIKDMIASEGSQHELAVADALLDLDSIQSITAGLGVGRDGLSFDIQLRLDEGHRSLVFNFFRTPVIDNATLRCIPAGAAAFAVGALNVAPVGEPPPRQAPDGPPVVTALDFGRELFGNIAGFGIYVLPPDAASATGNAEVPDVAGVFTVNDPAKSRVLWTQMLGLISLASGGHGMQATTTRIEGVEVASYAMPEGVTVHFATIGRDVLVSPSLSAMGRSIAAKRHGRSILQDDAMAGVLPKLGADSTKAIVVHVGRAAAVARPFMGRRERAEAEPFMAALSDTVVSLVVDHSEQRFRLSASVAGVPDIGDLVSALMTAEWERGHAHGGRNAPSPPPRIARRRHRVH